jgi:hypothetical protein
VVKTYNILLGSEESVGSPRCTCDHGVKIDRKVLELDSHVSRYCLVAGTLNVVRFSRALFNGISQMVHLLGTNTESRYHGDRTRFLRFMCQCTKPLMSIFETCTTV